MDFFDALRLIREEIDKSPDAFLPMFDSLPDAKKYSKEQLTKGLKVELEHIKTVDGDPVKVARIVLDHLRERPDYYEKLTKAGL